MSKGIRVEPAVAQVPEGVVVIECVDGRAYIGATQAEALDAMRAAAWGCPDRASRPAYMKAVARRLQAFGKIPIRTDSVAAFINDLQTAGVIVVRSVH